MSSPSVKNASNHIPQTKLVSLKTSAEHPEINLIPVTETTRNDISLSLLYKIVLYVNQKVEHYQYSIICYQKF